MSDVLNLDQFDLFVADISDVAAKGDIHSMEYPIFAISTRPDRRMFRYDNPATGNWLEVIPSVEGRATMHDKDILLYCFGQIAEGLNRGKKVSRLVRFTAYDFLVTTGRGTGGRSYKNIMDSLARLRGTTFKTNVLQKGESRKTDVFGLIDSGKAVTDKNGRLQSIEVVISEQLFESISNNKALTYNPEYFQLGSSFDRRLYEICRKHCGNQPIWEIGLEKLWAKFGVRTELKEFRRRIKDVLSKQNIPDYFIDLETSKESGTVEKLIVMLDKDGKMKELSQ